jgi:hypothetical protein
VKALGFVGLVLLQALLGLLFVETLQQLGTGQYGAAWLLAVLLAVLLIALLGMLLAMVLVC